VACVNKEFSKKNFPWLWFLAEFGLVFSTSCTPLWQDKRRKKKTLISHWGKKSVLFFLEKIIVPLPLVDSSTCPINKGRIHREWTLSKLSIDWIGPWPWSKSSKTSCLFSRLITESFYFMNYYALIFIL